VPQCHGWGLCFAGIAWFVAGRGGCLLKTHPCAAGDVTLRVCYETELLVCYDVNAVIVGLALVSASNNSAVVAAVRRIGLQQWRQYCCYSGGQDKLSTHAAPRSARLVDAKGDSLGDHSGGYLPVVFAVCQNMSLLASVCVVTSHSSHQQQPMLANQQACTACQLS
jgi:hypothetical protein